MRCWGFEEGVIVDIPVEQPRLCFVAGHLYNNKFTYHIFIHIRVFSAVHFSLPCIGYWVGKFFGLEVWFEVGLKLA